MTRLKVEPKNVVALVLASLLFISGAAWQTIRAQAASASPAGIAPLPPYLPPRQAPDQPAAHSSTLSYYFISGDTFTADTGSAFYTRNLNGCVDQMPLDVAFSAPVHLPQASVVVSMTLYTLDSAITTTVSTAYFFSRDGQGSGGNTLTAVSAPNTLGYQHQDSTESDPTTIDNQNDSYLVKWRKVGTYDSPNLMLCGVRLSYYAPLGGTFLPVIVK